MAYLELKREFDQLLKIWQRDMKRMFLLASIAKENGMDLDWILKADDETVTNELVAHRPREVVHITDPLPMWTPPEDWEGG